MSVSNLEEQALIEREQKMAAADEVYWSFRQRSEFVIRKRHKMLLAAGGTNANKANKVKPAKVAAQPKHLNKSLAKRSEEFSDHFAAVAV